MRALPIDRRQIFQHQHFAELQSVGFRPIVSPGLILLYVLYAYFTGKLSAQKSMSTQAKAMTILNSKYDENQ